MRLLYAILRPGGNRARCTSRRSSPESALPVRFGESRVEPLHRPVELTSRNLAVKGVGNRRPVHEPLGEGLRRFLQRRRVEPVDPHDGLRHVRDALQALVTARLRDALLRNALRARRRGAGVCEARGRGRLWR